MSTPPRLYGTNLGTYYATMIIFNYVISIVETGFITFLFMEILGYDGLFLLWAIMGTVGLLIVICCWEKEEITNY